MAAYLDLVALGTVADVAPLDQNNRILVEQGLRRIRAGRCAPGIQLLLKLAGHDPKRAVASDLAFSVGPRLNAAGRLQDMSLGIECLLNDDEQRVMELAKRLDELNQQRREIGDRMHSQALLALQAVEARLGQHELPYGVCLFDKDWHQGIIGILAARIKERFHRPVIAFAHAGEGVLKGSARSVPGLHLRDVLEAVAAQYPDLISRFGGHAMAAGLTLPMAHIDAFRSAFDHVVRATISPDQLSGALYTDGELSEADFTLELARLLRRAGPWGQGFPEPVFDGVFEIVSQRVVAERHLKLRVRPDGCACVLDAMVFNHKASNWHSNLKYARMVYRFEENEYQGRVRAQLIVTHAQPT
jgi:single-stranded-DNA-specific exonuclease